MKPSSSTILAKVIESAIEQHRLIVAERQLTEQTRLGCVEVLAEVLSIVEPVVFSRTTRIRRYVRHVTDILRIPNSWELEAAAMLSQIGWIAVPQEIAVKAASRQELSAEERARLERHPAAAARILERIPRLSRVAAMIGAQLTPNRCRAAGTTPDAGDNFLLCAAVLQAAIDYDDIERAASHSEAIAQMRMRRDLYHQDVVCALECMEISRPSDREESVPCGRLEAGMLLLEDIRARNGICLVGAGQQITVTMLQRLAGFANAIDPAATVLVRISG